MELKLDLSGLNDPELIVRAYMILASLADHPAYKEGIVLPPSVPSLNEVQIATDLFRDSHNAAQTRDTVKLAVRNECREDLHKKLHKVGQYIVVWAGDDPNAIISAGFKPRRQRGPASTAPLTVPVNFTVRHGDNHTLIGKVSRLENAGSYEIEFTEGDPTIEEGWKHKAGFKRSGKMVMDGFIPGKKYSFRVRGIGANGAGPWSAVVSLIAI